ITYSNYVAPILSRAHTNGLNVVRTVNWLPESTGGTTPVNETSPIWTNMNMLFSIAATCQTYVILDLSTVGSYLCAHDHYLYDPSWGDTNSPADYGWKQITQLGASRYATNQWLAFYR